MAVYVESKSSKLNIENAIGIPAGTEASPSLYFSPLLFFETFSKIILSVNPLFHTENAVASSPTATPFDWAPIDNIVANSLVISVFIPKL